LSLLRQESILDFIGTIKGDADNAGRRYVLQVWNHFCDLVLSLTLPNFTALKLRGSMGWQAAGSKTQ